MSLSFDVLLELLNIMLKFKNGVVELFSDSWGLYRYFLILNIIEIGIFFLRIF